jgi:hypothetical protein
MFYFEFLLTKKKSAKQTCSRLLGSFAIKGGIFKEMFHPLYVPWWEICGFAICELASLKNLRIYDLRINLK